MCEFFSCIMTKPGKLVYDLNTDSHEDLIEITGLRDNPVTHARQNFVRLEFVPAKDKDLSQVDSWELKVDEQEIPDWFDPNLAKEKIWGIIQPLVITDHREFLLGEYCILTGKAKIDRIKNTKILLMNQESRVDRMLGFSQVGEMHHSSQVGEMHNSSQVGEMHNSSQVGKIYDFSQVGIMFNSSQVGEMHNSSQVSKMYHFSQIGMMCNSSQVGIMFNSTLIKKIFYKSRVITMNSEVGIIKDLR